jgi:hypothetical protein
MVNLSSTTYKLRAGEQKMEGGGGKEKRKPGGAKFWRRREGQ